MSAGRSLIVTADDFGLSLAVNDAVERAHREGILTAASLMVAADGTADAVRRARGMPSLRVGLHVVVVNGRPVLPAREIPAIVDGCGDFLSDVVRASLRVFFDPRARRQMEAEIRAQFEAFRATGLQLDHVNSQNHMHVHPTILALIVKVGRDFGVPAIRIPYEPFLPSWRSAHRGLRGRLGNDVLLAPWMALMRARLRRAGIAYNDRVFGLNDTGEMSAERIVALLEQLPPGLTELYTHPEGDNEESRALIDPAVLRAVAASGSTTASFGELQRHGG